MHDRQTSKCLLRTFFLLAGLWPPLSSFEESPQAGAPCGLPTHVVRLFHLVYLSIYLSIYQSMSMSLLLVLLVLSRPDEWREDSSKTRRALQQLVVNSSELAGSARSLKMGTIKTSPNRDAPLNMSSRGYSVVDASCKPATDWCRSQHDLDQIFGARRQLTYAHWRRSIRSWHPS